MTPFLYFLLLIILPPSLSQHWHPQITLEDPSTPTLKRGIYKPFHLTLTSPSLTPHRSKALLQITPTLSPHLHLSYPVLIDTHKHLSYSFHIGFSKSEPITDGQPLTITFQIINLSSTNASIPGDSYEDAADFSAPNSIDVQLSTDKEQIYFGIAYPYLPTGSWTLYRLMDNIKNVDPISVSFASYIADGISIEAKEFAPYTVNHVNDDEKWSGRIYADVNARNGARVLDVVLDEDSPFYIGNGKEIMIHVTKGGIAEMTEMERSEMMKTVEVIDDSDINRISFQLKVIAFPTMLTCLCLHNGRMFPYNDDDIRNYLDVDEMEESQHQKLFQRFITNQQYQTVFFDEMSRLGRFKIKCLLDNTSTYGRKSFSFTIGNFEDADVKMMLMNEANAPLYPNCVTFNFKGNVDDKDEMFLKKIDYYSNDYVSKYIKEEIDKDNGKYLWKENGCFIWNKRDLVDLPNNAIGFCLEGVENCNTVFPYNSTDIVMEYISTLNTTEKFKKNIGGEYELDSISLETDNSAPDISLIKGNYVSSNDKHVIVNITNNINQRILCHYKKARRVSIYEVTTEDILGYNIIYLEANETRDDVEILLEQDGFNEQMYAVMLICMNNPGASYSSHYTHPFPLVVYYNRRGFTVQEYDIVPKTDCDLLENRYVEPECMSDIHAHDIPQYEGKFKKENNTDDEELFSLMPNIHQIQLLEDEIHFMEKASDIISYFDDMSYVGEMLGKRKCEKTQNYAACRFHKQEIYSAMFNHFQETFNPYNCLDVLESTGANRVKAVKSFLETVFYLTNNPDCISEIVQIEFLFDLLEEMNVQELFTFSEADIPDRVDIVKLLTASTVNLLDILIFANVDYIITENTNMQTGIIEDNGYRLRQQFIMEYLLKQFWDLGITYFDYDTFGFYLYSGVRDPYSSHFNDDWEVETYFEKLDIEVTFRHILLQKYQGDYIHVYSYQRYPHIKIGTRSIYTNFVGIAMYDKEQVLKDVSDIERDLMVNVTYYNSQNINSSYTACLIYDEVTGELSTDGAKFEKTVFNNVNYQHIRCRLSRFGDVSLGHGSAITKKHKTKMYLIVVLVVVVVVLLCVVGYALMLFVKKKAQKIIPDSIADGIQDKSPLMEEI